jgi:5-methylcytosine-specific restriction endonuclease McrA
MPSLTDRYEVLKLNRHRVPIHLATPEKVFGDLFNWLVDCRQEYIRDRNGNRQRKMLAFDLTFHQRPDGSYDFDVVEDIRLVDGDEWITLPIRSYDLVARTPRTQIRIPRVVMSLKYDGINSIKYSKSYNDVYDLYDGVCALTKRKLKRSEGSKDHVIPISRGGKDELSDIVLCDKKVNNMKGDRYNHEVGLPDVTPIIPKNKPRYVQLRKINKERQIPEWRYFLGE